jgi:MinD superfamily P-loop ATPase
MRQITVLSGKGGTGKTSLTASFAVLANNAIVADCDVDAPDLHLLLHPQPIETLQFWGSKLAVIDPEKCVKCGLCQPQCRFNAITDEILVDTVACEGCGVCVAVCPQKAVILTERICGSAFISKISHGYMSHALLNPGEANSGKLVTLVRQNAKNLVAKHCLSLVLIDGPPGIGCPVIASISGVDAALIVTEPTMSGIHDLKRVLQLLNHFNLPCYVCVNMYDVNFDNTEKIESFCRKNSVQVVGRIPFDPQVTEAMVNGKTIVEYSPKSRAALEIKRIFEKLTVNPL